MNKTLDWFDEQLSKITMYNIVVLGLVLISIMSLALMFSGYLTYEPIHFIISIVIFTGVSYGSNRLFGWLFGIKPHSQSAVITGLILALLFTPPAAPFTYAVYALIAVIAMASKYVITFRNRHIFNPAAVAIVAASVTKIAFASWWIATPALLPVTFLVALVILLRTKKVAMASIYVGVSVITILVMTAIGGDLTTQSVLAALTSWPLIFVAGIMLSEPLTLPPRRNQQYIIAGIVGFLGVLSIHYGPITMTPALALLAGNAIAWRWGTRGVMKLRFLHKQPIGKNAYEFTFDTNGFAFTPGQYIELTLPHRRADSRGVRRVFSIVGHPEDNQVSLAMRVPEKASSFKKSILALKKGETVYGARVAGDFILPKDQSVPIVMIAGGIGITPFISHLLSAGERTIMLIYVVSSVDDLMFAEELRRYNVKVVIVSPEKPLQMDQSWIHISAKTLNAAIIKKCLGLYEDPEVFISGAPRMVDQAKRDVRQLGVRRIHTDHFAGY